MGWFDIFALVALVFVSVFGTAITLYTSWYKQRAKSFWEWCKHGANLAWDYARRNRALSFSSILFVFLCGLFLVLFFVWVYPIISSLYGTIADEIDDIELYSRAFRNASLSVAGSITLLIAVLGMLLTIIRSILIREQNRTDEQRLVIENIGQAITQIGAFNGDKPNIEVRLGGLYSLQRIMQDSSKDELSIVRILYAYVRENTKRDKTKQPKHMNTSGHETYQMPEDILAALHIISQFNREQRERGKWIPYHAQLNFSHVDFSDYFLAGIDFSYAILEYANLSGTDLARTNLSRASLRGANLSGVSGHGLILSNADLVDVDFSDANLFGAIVGFDSILVNINFTNADLSAIISGKIGLHGVNLLNADLENSGFEGSDLSNAYNLTQEQINQARGDKDTKLPEGLTMPKSWENPEKSHTTYLKPRPRKLP